MQAGGTSGFRLLACLIGMSLAAAAGIAVAEPCRKVTSEAELASYTEAQGTQATLARNICYAEGTEWLERNRSNSANVKLDQRFDYYRPSALAPTQKLPLIIWAHPNGMSEDLAPEDNLYTQLVTRALDMGFAFMSVEFRHPVSSQEYSGEPKLDIPNTDIARAVQWARHRAAMLGVDPTNIFLVGQSRGTLGLLNALSRNLADADSPFPYRTKSSRVRAVYAVQAQTTYVRDQIKRDFIQPADWTAFDSRYANFLQPGSAVDEISTDDPPVAMRYEQAPTDPGLKQVVPLYLPRSGACSHAEGCFDIHHPNFGLKLHLAFNDAYTREGLQPPASKFNIAYNVPPAYYFVDQATNKPYACFFAKNLTPEGRANLNDYAISLCGI